MNDIEFAQIGAYLIKLWPAFKINAEQTAVWRAELLPHDAELVRQAIDKAYAKSEWREPYLGDVKAALTELRKLDMAPRQPPAIPEETLQSILEHDRRLKREHAERNGGATRN